MKFSIVTTSIAAALSVIQVGNAAPLKRSTLYIFGDSLSDIGTLKQLTLGLVPPNPYWKGRFSSGPVWNEYMSKLLGYNLYNKAIGGSQSANPFDWKNPVGSLLHIPSAQDQINYFKFTRPLYGLTAGQYDDIAALEIGANDYFFNMLQLMIDPNSVDGFVQNLAETVVDQLEQLKKIGFKKIAFTNLAAIQYTPLAKILKMEDLATKVVTSYNKLVSEKVNAWAKTANLKYFMYGDLGGFVEVSMQDAVASALGLTDVTSSCVGGNFLELLQTDNILEGLLNIFIDSENNIMCEDPSTNFFFDIVHPGERVQRLFAYYSYELYNAETQGKTFNLTADNLVKIISKYNLNTVAPKPVAI